MGSETPSSCAYRESKPDSFFFQAKTIPTPLWTAVDQVLNFSFIVGHTPGKENATADFLSRVNVNPHTTHSPQISTRMPVNHVEIDFLAESPNPDLTALTASTTSGLAALQCYEDDDDYLDVKLEPQGLPQSINALAQENTHAFFELLQNDAPLDLLSKQMKAANILKVIT